MPVPPRNLDIRNVLIKGHLLAMATWERTGGLWTAKKSHRLWTHSVLRREAQTARHSPTPRPCARGGASKPEVAFFAESARSEDQSHVHDRMGGLPARCHALRFAQARLANSSPLRDRSLKENFDSTDQSGFRKPHPNTCCKVLIQGATSRFGNRLSYSITDTAMPAPDFWLSI
jgi:hypothetical protein